jgi:A/G-specific adenine glycosylase
VTNFPSPKPAKSLPVKEKIFLLLRDDASQIWLEKRPPSGIWGGLWSVPEFDSIEAAQQWCLVRDLQIVDQQVLNIKRHTFSHYHLDYTPLLIQTKNPNNFVMEANLGLWYKADQFNDLGLAAPIKLLLQYFSEDKK